MKRKKELPPGPPPEGAFLHRVMFAKDAPLDSGEFPFTLPVVQQLPTLKLQQSITIFVGENGTGKSTLMEALAGVLGANIEGGSRNFRFDTSKSHTELHDHLTPVRGSAREKDVFFLRAESMYNTFSELQRLNEVDGGAFASYGGRDLHTRSHGQSFFDVMEARFGGDGIYLLDEPESALSPTNQMAAGALLHRLANRQRSQILLATHSPILLAIPGAKIYQLESDGIREVGFEESELFQLYRQILRDPQGLMRRVVGMRDEMS